MANTPTDASARKALAELQRQVEELKLSQERFQTLVEYSPDFIWEVDDMGRFSYVSPNIKTYGYAASEFIGRAPREFLAPSDLPRYKALINKHFSEKRPFVQVVSTVVNKSGQEVVLEYSGTPFFDVSGAFKGFRGIARDITQRTRAEAALKASQNRLRTTLESITDAFFTLDRHWRFTFMNLEAETLLKRSKEALLGKDMWKEFPEAIGLKFYREYHRAVEENTRVIFEEYYPPHGVWVEIVAYPSEEGLSVIARDVSKRKQAEDALKESEQRYRSLISAMAEGVVLISQQGILTCNSSAERILGLGEQDLLGKMVWELGWEVVREDGSPLAPGEVPSNITLRTGLPQRNAVLGLRTPGGPTLWLKSNTQPLWREHEGQPYGVVVSFTDITAFKQTEEELREVRQRLAESQEAERLHLARELHDGPVQQLIGTLYELSQLKQQTAPQPELSQALGGIAKRLQEVTQQLRGVIGGLRPPGLVELGFSVTLNHFVEALEQELRDQAPDIDLDIDTQPPLPEASLICLYRAAQEGLRNAIRHAGASSVEVQLRQCQNEICLTVRDNGRGFGVPEHLYDLAKCNHFGLVGIWERASALGGRLEISSRPGAGTKLLLALPLPRDPVKIP